MQAQNVCVWPLTASKYGDNEFFHGTGPIPDLCCFSSVLLPDTFQRYKLALQPKLWAKIIIVIKGGFEETQTQAHCSGFPAHGISSYEEEGGASKGLFHSLQTAICCGQQKAFSCIRYANGEGGVDNKRAIVRLLLLLSCACIWGGVSQPQLKVWTLKIGSMPIVCVTNCMV